MKKRIKKTLSVLALCTLVFAVTGCAKEKEANLYEEFIVVDVFDSLANFQGIQSGWFAEIVKDKFNMELNIIAAQCFRQEGIPCSRSVLRQAIWEIW